MGNSSSEHQMRFFRSENLSNDPSAFRVFVKKRNKFIPGWLKISDDEIVFYRGGNNIQFWSLAHLRRYGYTCSGVFFFESGRRCATGEGLHTFQSHQAERIFHMVQSKIKIEEYARGSRAGSVASGRLNSLVPNPSNTSRIHPVQRFSSEGANNEFSPHLNNTLAPPPYNAFQEARRAQHNPSPNCPSTISSVSAYARMAALRERPHSVVSNIEHNVIMPPNNIQPRPNPIQTNCSSSTLLQHMLQHKHGKYALPPHMNSLAASASGSCIMNQSYHSALDSGSPWASQQQLDGEIVMEHVLPEENRRRLIRPTMNGMEPLRVAVPPPRPTAYYGQQQQQPNIFGAEAMAQRNGDHAYINVELRGGDQANGGLKPPQNGYGGDLNVRELHRTDRSRLEFLSTGPGAFQLPHYTSTEPNSAPIYYQHSGPPLFVHPSSAAMQHSFHQMPMFHGGMPNSPYRQSPQQMPIGKEHYMMSQSISGALPPNKQFSNNQNDQPSLLFTSNSMEQIGTANGRVMPLNYALIETNDGNNRMGCGQQPHQQIKASNSTLITSSTNTMASN